MTPSGETTFVTLFATPEEYIEEVATTITGLQAGGSYNLSVFVNGNYDASYVSRACSATVVIDGVSTTIAVNTSNTWAERLVPFVATGTTATVTIAAANVAQSGEWCLSNYFVGADAVVAAGTDVQVNKTVSPTGAVASGSVLTYTLVATNNGPSDTTNALLSDTPSAGLDCTTPSTIATCSASGGASCPSATVLVSSLTGSGVTLPSLPVGGQVTVTVQCTATGQ